MNQENIIVMLSTCLITGLGFWLKSVIPNWLRYKQQKDLKLVDAEIQIKDRYSSEDIKRDNELIKICSDIVKSLPELIHSIRDGFANVNNNTVATVVATQTAVIGGLESQKEQLKNHMDQVKNEIIKEIQDQKIKQLNERLEKIEKSPESKVG